MSAQNSGPEGKLDSQLEPGLELGPSPRVHAHLAPAFASAATDKQGAATGIEIGLGKGERFLDAQPGPPEDHNQPTQPTTGRVVTGGAHDGDDLLHLGRIGGIAETLCCVAVDRRGIRHGRGRSASTSAIAQQPVCAFDGCRARFEPVQPTQRYCGPPCRQRAKNRTVAQRRRDGVYTKNGGRRRLGVSDAERKLSAAYRRVLRADPCAYCGEPGGALDHVEPRHLGGADDWTNLAGVCGSCNSAKTLGLLDFLLTQRHRESIAPVVEQIERMGRGRASLRV